MGKTKRGKGRQSQIVYQASTKSERQSKGREDNLFVRKTNTTNGKTIGDCLAHLLAFGKTRQLHCLAESETLGKTRQTDCLADLHMPSARQSSRIVLHTIEMNRQDN